MKELTEQQINLLSSLVACEIEGLEDSLDNIPDLEDEVAEKAEVGVMLKALKEVQDALVEPGDTRLPSTYAEIEYMDMENPEAIDGARFDDMNYQHYMER